MFRHREAAIDIEIIPYAPRYAQDFKRLNVEWLCRYFKVEPIDEETLSHPQRIIDDGGFIFFARAADQIIGTCALIRKSPTGFELSKMAVTESYQGQGIGRGLLSVVLDAFDAHSSTDLFLESNAALTAALQLYESLGFEHSPRPGSSTYERADVYMVYRGRGAIR